MPSIFTHLDIADRCIQSAQLEKKDWFDHNSFLSGSLAPDLGYFNHKELPFTNLAHSRKGRKIIKKLLKQSKTPQELSFSLGFLSHNITDRIMEKLVNWQARKIKYTPWYILKKQKNIDRLLEELHHKRIEWSLDVDIINTLKGSQLFNTRVYMPNWENNNLVTKTYKNLFNMDINYSELSLALNNLNNLQASVSKIISIGGIKNIFNKKYYPLERLGQSVARKFFLLASNFNSRSVVLWSILDPYKLNKKQKVAFTRLRDRTIRLFNRYVKNNKYIRQYV